ncbi:unnamed protein product [Macrosiphum euphorbiae]|uniref:Transposase domain-containing protein n=1 Tax=Macrosiphum euphorbiae TaxID=13131 RepID=A0AAV0XS20_9HEMI|nr:unnamed protein product [Macrosiphum euphorbiae]CAI6374252.1 unnamed protein product [Macrosiphum euphorbiae]
MASYRNKRRKIQEELKTLDLSSNDSNYFPFNESNNSLHSQQIENNKILENSLEQSIEHDNISQAFHVKQARYQSDLNSAYYGNNESESDKEIKCNNHDLVKKKLGKWMIDYNVNQNSVNSLLKILKNDCNLEYLPKDCRTLLKSGSSKVTNIINIDSGIYYHFGLAAGILRFSSIISSTDIIKIALGIDGLPITKSSSSQFWPILAYIMPHKNYVFPVGIYHGHEKPQDSNIYLRDLVSEILELTMNGIIVNSFKKDISIEVICCDSPAKAYLMRAKGHSGFSSCSRCTHEGAYMHNRVCFPYSDTDCTERTHEDYILMKNEEYHTSTTISCLTLIPNINIVKIFSMDYMHLICLGVMKKLINLWLSKGPVNSRIPSWKCKTLTKSLLQLKTCITRDFCRKPRPIQDVCRWKATEFRQFLLYTGPVVLKDILNEECYQNFLSLHISMRILLSDNNQQLLHYTRNLLKYFVKSFQYIYGAHFISHNVHGILHLCDDYERYGPLDACSTFPFENYMKVLKKMLHKNEKPLQQVIRRYNELCKNESILPISHNELKYSNQKPDCFVLTTSNEIVQIIELKKSSDKITVFYGKTFEEKEDLFIKPLKSSVLNIFVIKTLSEDIKQWNISDIKNKMVVFDLNDKLTAIPILHHN